VCHDSCRLWPSGTSRDGRIGLLRQAKFPEKCPLSLERPLWWCRLGLLRR
jgi:hypothetical protein